MKIKLTLEYDGSSFVGWQEQANGPGVQAELRVAIDTYLRSLAKRSGNALPNPVFVSGSGRTDSGVHALGQVASFSWPEALPFDQALVAHSVNGILPKQIAIRNLEVVEESFDARLTRHRKQYSYYFTLRRGSERGNKYASGQRRSAYQRERQCIFHRASLNQRVGIFGISTQITIIRICIVIRPALTPP